MKTRRLSAALLACALLGAGCRTYEPLPPDSIQAHLSAGDRVRVTDVYGFRHEFEVVRVGEDTLVGEEYAIAWGEVETVETVHRSILPVFDTAGRTLVMLVVAAALTFPIWGWFVFA